MSEHLPRGTLDIPEADVADWVARVRRLCSAELRGIPADGLIVDVCSGEGGVARGLLPEHRIVGVEHSWERCRRCVGRVAVLQGDACRLPLRDCCASAVFFFEGIEHLADPHGALVEIRRILSPGGLLFASTPNAIWISLRRLRDHGALRPPRVRRAHLREWAYGFPSYLARRGFAIERRTSPDPLGMSLWRHWGGRFPEWARWLVGCSQLVIARRS